MSSDAYLRSVLAREELNDAQLDELRKLRIEIESCLSTVPGAPRFYYAGSFGKKTMIRSSFDLDIVAYWPNDCGMTLSDLFGRAGAALQRRWQYVNRKKVAWTLPFQGGFHIDVVPGRALDRAFLVANLFRSDTGTPIQTSVKKHIDTVRASGRRDAIRLMKVWRHRKGVPLRQSLALELLTIDGCNGISTDLLERQVMAALRYIYDRIADVRVVDPANSNNYLTDDLTAFDRAAIKVAAAQALSAKTWSEVVG